MNILNLLDNSELGAKLRALLTLLLGLVTAAIGVLQGALDVLSVLPKWQWVGTASMGITWLAVSLGRYTKVGNKTGGA